MNLYQDIRTDVKKGLYRVTDYMNMEKDIRASTPISFEEAEEALRDYLSRNGFHVIHETDVKAIHNHYTLSYPKFKILKVVRAQRFMNCPMASSAVQINTGSGAVLPPGIILYESDGETRVSAVRPSTLLATFRDSDLRHTIRELEGYLWQALEQGIPRSRMLSTEPPVPPGQNEGRAKFKMRLNHLLSLVDGEYNMHISTQASPTKVKQQLKESLSQRGQKVLGEVADGRIMLVVNPGQAHKALAIDPDVAVFAPLSVSVYREDGRTHVRTVRPSTLLIFYSQPDMQDLLMEMEMLLWNGLVDGVPGGQVESRQPPLQGDKGQGTTAAGLPGGLDSLKKYRPQ